MLIIRSNRGIPIKLSLERWKHIVKRHPEMKGEKDKLFETIANPDLIQQGDYGELLAIRFFTKTLLTEKYMVVIYKEIDNEEGFVITAYFTRKPLDRRLIIWKG